VLDRGDHDIKESSKLIGQIGDLKLTCQTIDGDRLYQKIARLRSYLQPNVDIRSLKSC